MRYFVLLLSLSLMVACRQFSPRPDLSGIPVDFRVYRFESDLYSMDTTQLPSSISFLQEEYPDFFDLYTQGILRIGSPEEAVFSTRLMAFLADPIQNEAYEEVNSVFEDFSPFSDGIAQAYRYFNFYFPEIPQPDIYTFIGFFNQSMVADSGLLAVALEKYLSPRFSPYIQLGIPSFAREKMDSKYLVSDVIRALGRTEFEYRNEPDNLIHRMIYEGMILYFVAQVMPDIEEEILLQFTEEELAFFKKNEAGIWKHLIEENALFQSELKLMMRYLNDGPFTPGIDNSPPRAGIYIGYRLVQSFMKNNSNFELPDLMKTTDYQLILNRSGYKP